VAKLKTAAFTVRATEGQSLRWKRAAEAAGHISVGTWAADALDKHLDTVIRAGRPIPLGWTRYGVFKVRLVDGREIQVTGRTSPPFGILRGDASGPLAKGCQHHSLVFIPGARVLATMRKEAHCKALASELARLWVRWGGSEPAEDPGAVIDRHRREDV